MGLFGHFKKKISREDLLNYLVLSITTFQKSVAKIIAQETNESNIENNLEEALYFSIWCFTNYHAPTEIVNEATGRAIMEYYGSKTQKSEFQGYCKKSVDRSKIYNLTFKNYYDKTRSGVPIQLIQVFDTLFIEHKDFTFGELDNMPLNLFTKLPHQEIVIMALELFKIGEFFKNNRNNLLKKYKIEFDL